MDVTNHRNSVVLRSSQSNQVRQSRTNERFHLRRNSRLFSFCALHSLRLFLHFKTKSTMDHHRAPSPSEDYDDLEEGSPPSSPAEDYEVVSVTKPQHPKKPRKGLLGKDVKKKKRKVNQNSGFRESTRSILTR